MKILAFAASVRAASYNQRLINVAVKAARNYGADVDLADFHEFDMPLYDADHNAAIGQPPGAQEMIRRIEGCDGIIISSPEYNNSLPGTLKNAIDWVSRNKPMPLRGKTGLLLSASTSTVGGLRGLWQLRIPLESLGVFVYPDMYGLAQAHNAFDEFGGIKDGALAKRLENLVTAYLETTEHLIAETV